MGVAPLVEWCGFLFWLVILRSCAHSSPKFVVSEHGSGFHAYSSLKFVVSEHGSGFHAYSNPKFVVSEHGSGFHAYSSPKFVVSEHGSRFHAYSSLKIIVSKHGFRFHAYSTPKFIVSKHEINFLIEFFGRLPIHIENMARIGRMEISRLFLGLEIDHTTLPATSSSKIALK